ncbi:acyloxyacyl hydrolase [Mucilaginibacter sp. UYCu711]|uniref:acyloxyacyl hydrolase n=1 Tax=Mucilaginibacter sp. UYCu711 TaxID=3156339 RepID=UPI003D25A19A
MITLFLLNICLAIPPVFAQEILANYNKNRLGFSTGTGVQYIGQLVGIGRKGFTVASNYYYHVNFYEIQFYRTLKKRPVYQLDLLVQPQYNVSRYGLYPESVPTDYLDSYEYGLNLGLLYRRNWGGGPLSYYVALSTGPHYASGVPHRQMSGFLFANNLVAGLNLKVYKTLYADVSFGLRHMSNAGTRLPNAGVNNLVFKEGFVVGF